MIKVTSKDGFTVEVFNHDGVPIKGITSIVIDPLQVNTPVTATLTFALVQLELNLEESIQWQTTSQ